MQDRETGWGFAGVVAAVYLAFLIWMHLHHELWRDEAHAWSLARIAQGFGDLVSGDRRYEGHPPRWFWYLRVWSWIVPPVSGSLTPVFHRYYDEPDPTIRPAYLPPPDTLRGHPRR